MPEPGGSTTNPTLSFRIDRTQARVVAPIDPAETLRSNEPFESVGAAAEPVGTARDDTETLFDDRGARSAAVSTPSVIGIDDLALGGVLGEGGMGRVLLATQISLDRPVAVKILREQATEREAAALVREARTAGGLEHPSIIPVHALGTDRDGRPVLVMKRVEGVSWRAMLDQPEHASWHGRGDDRLAANLEILMQVCHALELAHSRGLVHRDIKPSNVMVGRFGDVYLVDWGLATSVEGRTGASEAMIVGTPAFLAPEMALGESVDARTDVYLLGATLHFVLTGRARHVGASFREVVLAAVASETVDYPKTVPPMLAALCNEATAGAPDARPSTVRVFRERLAAFLRRRSALSICEAASTSLVSLEGLLAAAPPNQSLSNPVAAYGLASEARFGLRESLKLDPNGDEATRAMRRCIVALVDLELRSGHVEAAELLLSDLTPADPALSRKVEEARAAAAAARQETDRLRQAVRDRDPSFSRALRIVFGVLFLSLAGGTPILVSVTHHIDDARGAAIRLLASILVTLGVTVIAALTFRRRFETSLSRGLVLSVLGTEMLVVLNRTLAVFVARPVSLTVRNDLLIVAASIAPLAALMFPRALVAALVAAVGAVCVERWPEHGLGIYGLSFVGFVASFVWAMWTRSRADDEGARDRR